MRHQYLYRYHKFYDSEDEEKKFAKKLFLNKEMKVFPFTDMNDPFEGSVKYQVGAKTDIEFRNLYNKLLKKRFPHLTDHDIQQQIEGLLAVHKSYGLDQLIEKFKEEQFREYTDKGIICLTTDPKSILMWSHYADNHRGYCLQFNTKSVFARAQKISYLPHPPEVDVYTTTSEKWYKGYLLMKFKTWKYESEYRLVVKHTSKTDKDVFYIFNEKDLSGVIWGCRMSSIHRQQITEWLKTWEDNKDVKLYEAVPNKDEYTVDIVPVK
ncbi:MAG: hypothetical protein ILNGONEN_02009 [Syntrophorhabdaceae bacterium]|nr:hypothetical protein [Syntrophorhabdaceae bacterium]